MPLYATTDYGRGNVGTSVGGLPQPVDTERYLRALLRAETRPRATAAETAGSAPAPSRPIPIPRNVPVLRDPNAGMSALEKQARDAQFRDVILSQQAREQGAPRVWRNPYGGPVLTTDPEGMNAYQREFYVPKESTHVASPDEEARAKANLLSELAFQRRFQEQYEKRRVG